MEDGRFWFAPKRFGVGVGRPIAWQGWVATVVFAGALTLAIIFLQRSPIALASVVVTISILFIILSSRTTRGGWHWRWGKEE